LRGPVRIEVDGAGKIFVSELSGHQIVVLNPDGTLFCGFGTQGNGNAQFSYPFGLSINQEGNLIVCDWNNHRVQIFE